MYISEALEHSSWEISEITSTCLIATPDTVYILNIRACMHLELCCSIVPCNTACLGIVCVQKLKCKSLDVVNYIIGHETGWNLVLET
jgi:hypothetical protein